MAAAPPISSTPVFSESPMREPSIQTALITGSNRGIGLALCEKLLSDKFRVIAVCRKSSPQLDSLAKLFSKTLEIRTGYDVCHQEAFTKLSEELTSRNMKITWLINNAGICIDDNPRDPLELTLENMRAQFEVNTMGPITVTLALLSNVVSGGKIINISSRYGSIPLLREHAATMHPEGGGGYSPSKAASNMFFFTVSHYPSIKKHKITVANVHPGFVKTEMNGGEGDITTEVSATAIVKLVGKIQFEDSGKFWHAVTGEVLPD